jgi:hypothetical protein
LNFPLSNGFKGDKLEKNPRPNHGKSLGEHQHWLWQAGDRSFTVWPKQTDKGLFALEDAEGDTCFVFFVAKHQVGFALCIDVQNGADLIVAVKKHQSRSSLFGDTQLYTAVTSIIVQLKPDRTIILTAQMGSGTTVPVFDVQTFNFQGGGRLR